AGVHCVAEPTQVCNVEDVEHLREDRKLPAFLEGEILCDSDVLRTEVITKRVAGRQTYERNVLTTRVLLAGVSSIPRVNRCLKLALTAATIQAVETEAGKWCRRGSVSVEIDICDGCRYRTAARH